MDEEAGAGFGLTLGNLLFNLFHFSPGILFSPLFKVEVVMFNDSLNIPISDDLAILFLIEQNELLFAEIRILFPQSDDAAVFKRSGHSGADMSWPATRCFQCSQAILIKFSQPFVKGAPANRKVSANQAGLLIGFGLVKNDPL